MKLQDQHNQARCILIMGMHRSGTSALTRCLNLLGADLGSHLLSPDSANTKGFWEHADAVRINDTLLHSLGMCWHSPDPLPEKWLESEGAARAREEIRELINRDFLNVPLWALKDPRMCRLAPLWIQVLRDMHIDVAAILAVRSPGDVAASLGRAHGLSTPSGVLSWLQHLAESEATTRSITRVMVDYERLLDDPLKVLSHAGHALKLTWPISIDSRKGAITSFLDADLRTHRKAASTGELPPLMLRASNICHRIAVENDGSAWSDLSCLADECMDVMHIVSYLRRESGRMAALGLPGPGAPLRFLANLYYADEHGAFTEENVIRKEVSAGRTHLEFSLPDVDTGNARFRFDPLEGPGCCVLHAMVVLDSNGAVVWDGCHERAKVSRTGLRELESFIQPGRTLLVAGTDPQFEMKVDICTLPSLQGCVLSMDIDYLDPKEVSAELQAAASRIMQQKEVLSRQADALDERAADIKAISEKYEDELAQMRLAHAEKLLEMRKKMEKLMAEQQQELVAKTEELEQMHASLFWRVVNPVRRLSQRLPDSIRRTVRRLSMAAWWSLTPWRIPARLRARGLAQWSGIRLVANPAQHLFCTSDAGHARTWTAKGADPFFYLNRENGGAANKTGGWYMLDMEIGETSGALDGPKLYLDYGRNFAEVWALGLNHLRTRDGISGLIRFEHDVSRIRFDPSNGACEFILGRISLRRVTKVRAALYLYRSLVKRNGRAWELARGAVMQLAHGGVRQVGDWLYGKFAGQGKVEVGNYEAWIETHDVVLAEDLQAAREDALSLPLQPLISVVVPVFNTPESLLRRCIDSVIEQAYPHWELCIADDASTKPHVRKLLEQYQARDKRIKVTYRTSNGHISEASNSALGLVSGEWIALLDHDDELALHALYVIAKAINERPDAALLYSDEDKIDRDGRRYDPYFKPDWNVDLFYSHNMISHLGVYRSSLVRELGGFRKGYEGSQDYDLALRCIERIRGEQVVHVPRVLYHWRAVPGSTALGGHEKSYAAMAGKRALEEHFVRKGEGHVEIEMVEQGYRVRRIVNKIGQPKVSLIIPTRDHVELLRMCVQSILEKTEYSNYEIVIVDNQSAEPETLAYFYELRKDSRVTVLRYDAPFNYSKINNVAVASSSGEIVGLINNDIEVLSADWLCEMVGQAMRKEIGAVGAMLYYPNDTIQHAGVVLGVGGVAGHVYCGEPRGFSGQMGRARLTQNFSVVTAACLLVRREVFDAVGGLDEDLEVAFNDVDFCLRIQALGLRNVWTPYAELYHHESASRGSEDTPEKQKRFIGEVDLMVERWGWTLQRDFAYNPNLTLESRDFSLSISPRVAPLGAVVSRGASVLGGRLKDGRV